jgi:hypothetical protein
MHIWQTTISYFGLIGVTLGLGLSGSGILVMVEGRDINGSSCIGTQFTTKRPLNNIVKGFLKA